MVVVALEAAYGVHPGQRRDRAKRAICENISFDPLIMADGIAPTDDPVLLFRLLHSPSYALSFAQRRQGL